MSDQFSQPDGGLPPRQPPEAGSARAGGSPGWLSRSLLWASIVLDKLPAIIVLPLLSQSSLHGWNELYTALFFLSGFLGLLLFIPAFLLVRNTNWPRRLIGGGVCIAATVLGIVAPSLVSLLVFGLTSDDAVRETLNTVAVTATVAFALAAVLIAWNIVRNRRWWVSAVAAGLAVVIAVLTTVLQQVLQRVGAPPALIPAVGEFVALVCVFGALGVLHLLGRRRGGSVPVVPQPTLGERSAPSQAAFARPGYYGPAQPGYGPAQPGYGPAQPGSYGLAQPGYGPAQPGSYGPVQPGYGPAENLTGQPSAHGDRQHPPAAPGSSAEDQRG